MKTAVIVGRTELNDFCGTVICWVQNQQEADAVKACLKKAGTLGATTRPAEVVAQRADKYGFAHPDLMLSEDEMKKWNNDSFAD